MATAEASAVFVALLALFSVAAGVGFEFHHRFSDRVRQWAEERAVPGTRWPERGTVDYYTSLVHHDRALRGRSLADAGNATELTFSDGNATIRLSSLGFLHYALVELGTPSVQFLVALDTGSDLFWVPCNCLQCAPVSSSDYGSVFQNVVFNIFSPSDSSTIQKVSCSNSLCEQSNLCSQTNGTCPYSIEYASVNTSSTGILLEDVLHLTTEDATPKAVDAPIVFGCGEIQTGSFLRTAAPNGLFGLGRDKISVPSILAAKGFIPNSFSMCFGSDGNGRINFGDKGSSDQLETPFITSDKHPSYTINITGASVQNDRLGLSFNALIDSGTSFTILGDPVYTTISESFNRHVQEKRDSTNSSLPFDYCYDISPTQTSFFLPRINLTTEGGSIFHVNSPIILIASNGSPYMYCLAIIKSSGMNVIGQNFLTGLRIVFDRERQVLGWKNFDCYKTENTSDLSINNSPATQPAASPSSFTPSETSNKTQVQVTTAPSSSTGHPPHFSPITRLSLLLLLLYLAII